MNHPERFTPTDPKSDRSFYVFNAIVSVLALGFLAWLLILREAEGGGVDLRFLPAVNASLNGAASLCLIAGFVAIRRGARAVHQRFMVTAFACSSAFLISYVIYHYAHGDTKYTGDYGAIYFPILISHIILSIFVVPMALQTFYYAARRRFSSHKKIARILFPIWLYVSFTGVAIFFMLRG